MRAWNLVSDQDAVSTHSRLKAAGQTSDIPSGRNRVSTHSRLKAAGRQNIRPDSAKLRFNTQPPEGGWLPACHVANAPGVSTHSRLKAAGKTLNMSSATIVFQHTAA